MRQSYARTKCPRWTAPVARWSVWKSGAEHGQESAPDVGFIEPMLRRRLSSLARMSLRVAHDCAHDKPDLRVVYASRHGELARTTTMLDDLAIGETLSPTAFSLSVLNASAGLFSILQRSQAPVTAVSTAAASVGYGLLEACLQLASQPSLPVLLVDADEPVPEVYGPLGDDEGLPHALAVLLEAGAETRIECARFDACGAHSEETQWQSFLRCLETGNASWTDTEAVWCWHRL